MKQVFSKLHLGHLTDNGFQKKGKVGRNFIFCLYFQSNMGRVFIFCFYFQQFNNITQTSSILLFWQTNNTIVFTVNRQDSRLANSLPKLCPAVMLSHQDGCRSAVALLLKAALIQVSDYRLLGASGLFSRAAYFCQQQKNYLLCKGYFSGGCTF
jgi:hypothetical protein